MEIKEQLFESLNDLLKINSERITDYRKITDELEVANLDIYAVCDKIIYQSQVNNMELENLSNKIACSLAYTYISGKAHRIWLKLKSVFIAKDRISILNFMDFNEEAAEKAYEYVINELSISSEIKNVLTRQQLSLKTLHDIIKQINDSEIIEEKVYSYS
ncbi:MAG: hypothetical protein ABI315_11935 [Bacteroidia bacterium]